MADSALLNLMQQTVSVENVAAEDWRGEATGETAFTLKARVEGGRKLVRTKSGEEVVPAFVVYAEPSPLVEEDAKVTFDGSEYRALKVEAPPDETGAVHHQVIALG